MKLLKGTVFLRDFFDQPRPSKRDLMQWIERGEVPGKIIDDTPYVDVNRFIGQGARAVRASSTIDLLS